MSVAEEESDILVAEEESDMPVRSSYTITVNYGHCVCLCPVITECHKPCQSHHSIVIYYTPRASIFMHIANTRLNRVGLYFTVPGISAAESSTPRWATGVATVNDHPALTW